MQRSRSNPSLTEVRHIHVCPLGLCLPHVLSHGLLLAEVELQRLSYNTMHVICWECLLYKIVAIRSFKHTQLYLIVPIWILQCSLYHNVWVKQRLLNCKLQQLSYSNWQSDFSWHLEEIQLVRSRCVTWLQQKPLTIHILNWCHQCLSKQHKIRTKFLCSSSIIGTHLRIN